MEALKLQVLRHFARSGPRAPRQLAGRRPNVARTACKSMRQVYIMDAVLALTTAAVVTGCSV